MSISVTDEHTLLLLPIVEVWMQQRPVAADFGYYTDLCTELGAAKGVAGGADTEHLCLRIWAGASASDPIDSASNQEVVVVFVVNGSRLRSF